MKASLLALMTTGCGLPLLQTAAYSQFTCGPYTTTYFVKGYTDQPVGIRCLKFIPRSTPGFEAQDRVIWYGEGRWGTFTYRHLGFAAASGTGFRGSAGDLPGNGAIADYFSPDVVLTPVSGNWPAPETILVWGNWNETWYRAPSVNYIPLPRPQYCGTYFDDYEAATGLFGDPIGIRCVLRVSGTLRPWFGNGPNYTHIGVGNLPTTRWSTGSGGATDLCGLGPACRDYPQGQLRFARRYEYAGGGYLFLGFQVSGAWNEFWHNGSLR
jgi:hypothetical protein